MKKIDCFSKDELINIAKAYGQQAFRGRQLYEWIHNKHISSFEEMRNIPIRLRESLEKDFSFTKLNIINAQQSIDGSVKFLFHLEDGESVESVLLRDKDRLSGCISTQVGCKMGCKFCATSSAVGFKRNLSVGEVLGQIAALRKYSYNEFNERLGNLVFMGMGEPLDNINVLKKSLNILLDGDGFGFSHRKITVSTSGLIDGIKSLFEMEQPVNLAVSLNASNEELRKSIMPVTNKYSLKDLIHTLKSLDLNKRKRITFEYVLLKGVNDSLDNAKELVRLIKDIKSKVNLIVYNGSPYNDFQPPSEENVIKFQNYLIDKQISTFIRKRLGEDISGACGQLAAGYNK